MRHNRNIPRRSLLLAMGVMASGCTLRPLYGPAATDAAGPPRRVALAPMSGRQGYLFREALRRRFALDQEAPSVLTVALDVRERGVAITTLGDTTRFNIDGTAQFVLVVPGDDTEPLTGTVRSFSGYSTLASPYATRVAREAAEERVIGDLAERVFAQIAVRGPTAA
jgi:LPS-assembly lipoprotein